MVDNSNGQWPSPNGILIMKQFFQTRAVVALFAVLFLSACGLSQSDQPRVWNTAPGQYQVKHVNALVLNDAGQDRDVQMQVSYPVGKGTFPVVVFSHGAFCYPQNYRAITDFWVSNGYVVVALDHLDSPNLGKINPRVLPILQEARAKDLSFVLDSLDDIEVSIPEFAGKLDRERFAVAGHSFGGMISEVMVGAPITRPDGEVVSYADERFDAAVIISGVGPATMVDKSRLTEAAFDSINRPLFASGGTLDTGNVGTREQFPWEWRMSPYTLSPPEDKYSLVLENGDHYLGGEICRPNRGGDNDPQGVEIVRVLNTAFLDAYVKNDSAAKEFLRTVDVSSITSGRAALEYK